MTTPKLLDLQCNACHARSDNLSSCDSCKVVRYCSTDHQTEDLFTHEPLCEAVKKCRARTEREEMRLRVHPGTSMMPANPFDHPGHFWDWPETRLYMQERLYFMLALQRIRTREAIQLAYDTIRDLHRLDHSDNMSMRDSMPSLMLRLGKDQEAYDYMKWYATTRSYGSYDWTNTNRPFHNLQIEDAFESITVGDWTDGTTRLSHKIAIALLKLRLLFDLQSLHSSMQDITAQFPQELVDNVRQHLVSDVVSSITDIMQDVRNGVSIQRHIDNIESQLKQLFNAMNVTNKHFWPALVDWDPHNLPTGDIYVHGRAVDEMRRQVQKCHPAWEETPGAFDWVRGKLR